MTRNQTAALIATLGTTVMLIEIGLHWWASYHGQSYPIGAWPVLIGAAIAFVGAYIRDPKGAEDGGGFLFDRGIRILKVIRSGKDDEPLREGRRATDQEVVQVVDVTPDKDGAK